MIIFIYLKLFFYIMTIKKKILFFLLVLFVFVESRYLSAQTGATKMYTNYNGYTESSGPSTPINKSAELLGFTYSGNTYSTGVDDQELTNHLVPFTAQKYKAFPVPENTNFVGLHGPNLGIARYWGGTEQTGGDLDYIKTLSSPPYPRNFSYYMTSGSRGLEFGQTMFNIASQAIKYNLEVIEPSRAADGIPDLLITQTGAPATGSKADKYWFEDASGNMVGNMVQGVMSGIPILDTMQYTLYRVKDNVGNVDYNSRPSKQLRIYCMELTHFGINTANASNIKKFVHKTTGHTDIAFSAYDEETIKVYASDFDGDGISDEDDLDDDNDGILDTDEGNEDTDGDGILNSFDLDSDNDGCFDSIEGDENVNSSDLKADGSINVGSASPFEVDSNGVPNIVNNAGTADVGGDQGQGVGSSNSAGKLEKVSDPTDLTICQGVNAEFTASARLLNTTTYNSGSIRSYVSVDGKY